MPRLVLQVVIAHQDLVCAAPSCEYFERSELLLFVDKSAKYLYYRADACSDSISNNCTYVENPNYPSSESASSSCAYSVIPISTDICNLRLDFELFDLTGNLH